MGEVAQGKAQDLKSENLELGSQFHMRHFPSDMGKVVQMSFRLHICQTGTITLTSQPCFFKINEAGYVRCLSDPKVF